MVATTLCQTINTMAFNNNLNLLSGADIPFIEGTVTIHQPTIYEISMIGEEAFFAGCELLRFSKDILSTEDKTRLQNQSDFDIFMSIMNDKSGSMFYNISCAKQVLALIFAYYTVEYSLHEIEFRNPNTYELCGYLNTINFLAFKEILVSMFCLSKAQAQSNYNVQGDLAKKIAEKLKQRQQQLAELSPASTKTSIFSRYISILTVGEHKDMNSFMRYTVYQLFDEFQRFELKVGYDIYFQARIAGAKDIKEPEDWMKELHTSS